MKRSEVRKKLLIITGIIAVVGVIALLLLIRQNRSDLYSSPEPSASVSGKPSISPSAGKGTTVKGLTVTNVTPKISYTEAFKTYTGRLIQFDQFCHPLPYPNLVFKNGNSVMLDNRSAKPRTIKLDDNKIALKAYGWTVVSLRSTTLPRKVLLDCDNGQNYGSILLEK